MINIPVRETYTTGKQLIGDVVSIPKFIGSTFKKYTGAKRQRVLKKTKGFVPSTRIIAPSKSLYVRTHTGEMKERKCKQGAVSNAQPILTGSFQLLNGIAEGTGIDERIGRRIQIRSLSIRMAIVSPSTLASTDGLRIMLVVDHQPNGTIFTVGDLLADSSVNQYMNSHYNLNNRDRFTVITDRKMWIASHNGVGQLIQNITLSSKRSIAPTYNNTGATIADITTESIYLLIIGSSNAGGVNAATVSFYWRTRFYDS